MTGRPDAASERAWVRSVVERLAADTPFNARYLVETSGGSSPYLRELRIAAVWIARASVGLSPSGLARGFGRSRSAVIDQLNRADFLRDWDPDFRALTDRVARDLSDRIWVRKQHDRLA